MAKPDTPAPAAQANPVDIPGIVDAWSNDLAANLPQLRETDAWNTYRAAIEALKKRLQP